MRERMPLVCSDDYGRDADSAKTLLQKHAVLHEEINAYESEVAQLRENGKKMMETIKSNQVGSLAFILSSPIYFSWHKDHWRSFKACYCEIEPKICIAIFVSCSTVRSMVMKGRSTNSLLSCFFLFFSLLESKFLRTKMSTCQHVQNYTV